MILVDATDDDDLGGKRRVAVKPDQIEEKVAA